MGINVSMCVNRYGQIQIYLQTDADICKYMNDLSEMYRRKHTKLCVLFSINSVLGMCLNYSAQIGH